MIIRSGMVVRQTGERGKMTGAARGDGYQVHRVTIAAGALAVVGVLAALVILSLGGKSAADIGALFAFTVPVIATVVASLDKLAKNLDETRQQSETLGVIDHRTNGELDRRIRTQVDASLARWTGPPSTPVNPPESPETLTP